MPGQPVKSIGLTQIQALNVLLYMTQVTENTIWYDPKSQRVVVIQRVERSNVLYRNLGEDTVYMMPYVGFIEVFSCQKHSIQ